MEYGPLGSNEHLGTLAVDVKQIREHLKEWIATNQQVHLMSILGCLAAEFTELLAGILKSCGLNRQILHGKSISVALEQRPALQSCRERSLQLPLYTAHCIFRLNRCYRWGT